MKGQEQGKKYFWQLSEFKQLKSDCYEQTKVPQIITLYLYKKNIPGVIVRIINPIQKIYGWAFSQIQVLQRLNDNPRVYHWKQVLIQLKGELISNSLDYFNINLGQQILEAIPRPTESLTRWVSHKIDDVFVIRTKTMKVKDWQQILIELINDCRSRYKNYYRTRIWRDKTWQSLLDIAERQNLHANSSYGTLLQEIDSNICSTQGREQIYEDLFKGKSKQRSKSFKEDININNQQRVLQRYNGNKFIQE